MQPVTRDHLEHQLRDVYRRLRLAEQRGDDVLAADLEQETDDLLDQYNELGGDHG